MSLREIWVIRQAAARRDAHLAWLAACYAAPAYHAPNDMPGDPMDIEPASGSVPDTVLQEIADIRREVILARDTKLAQMRAKNGC